MTEHQSDFCREDLEHVSCYAIKIISSADLLTFSHLGNGGNNGTNQGLESKACSRAKRGKLYIGLVTCGLGFACDWSKSSHVCYDWLNRVAQVTLPTIKKKILVEKL